MVRTTRQNPNSKPSPKPNPAIAAIIAHQLENILLQIVTQVTANVNNENRGDGNGRHYGCSYKTFTSCNPKEFNGNGSAVALTRWIEKIESVFDNYGCIANQRVRYAASCFVNKALTWWKTQVQARGRECQKPKRAKDAAYHREKMLSCKQEEAGIQLNAKQADWRDDTNDDDLEDQELEAHYMYMSQLQEVSPDAA
nr:reverse transcriptase domain-containing protein [Tanacetum cinerariifolium]